MRRTARWLSIIGVAFAVLSLSLFHAHRIADPPYSLTGTFRFTWMLGYMAAIALATYVVGLPDQPRNKRQAAWLALLSTSIGAAAISMVQLATGDALLPRFVVFGAALANVPVQVAVSALSSAGRNRDEERDRVLLVAGESEHQRLVEDLRLEPEYDSSLVASITPSDVMCSDNGDGLIVELQRTSGATLVVLDHAALNSDVVIAQTAKLHESGVRVRTLKDFYARWLGKLPLDELERASLFFDISEIHRIRYSRTKRVMDVAVASFGALVLAVITPLVAFANLIGNRGPLIFRQTRVGKAGEEFTILKFRTMRELTDGPSDGHGEWTVENDPRITAFGRFLRKSHLDELPQMINILRGDLSLVGPRPEQPHYVKELADKLAFYNLRHLVRPGLTGWAQVKYGYAGDEADALEKLQYEFFYLQHQDMTFDLRIMLRTTRSVVGGQGGGR